MFPLRGVGWWCLLAFLIFLGTSFFPLLPLSLSLSLAKKLVLAIPACS